MIGGAIPPCDFRVSLDSMSASTAQLPRISLDTPRRVIGKKYHRLHEKRRHDLAMPR
ncbi:MAG: hypothetical protein ACLR8P_13455 [Clostridium fessum]